jgi:hypothetical protein
MEANMPNEMYVNKGIRISDKHYTIDMNHEAICKLQSMLILCSNTAPRLTAEDKDYLRELEGKIADSRQFQGEPA